MNFKEKKLCFTCFQPWTPGNKCTKGKAQYIKLFSDNDEYEEGKNLDEEEAYETTTEE